MLDQYGAEPFQQQQFGTAGIEGVKLCKNNKIRILELRGAQSLCTAASFSFSKSYVKCSQNLITLRFTIPIKVHQILIRLRIILCFGDSLAPG